MQGFPWDDLRKIFTDVSQIANVPNGVETLPKISIAWVGCTNVADDRQTTDRQTDGRRHIFEHEHEFTFAKIGHDRDSRRSGVAGPLAAWCGGQICCPIVLGFGKSKTDAVKYPIKPMIALAVRLCFYCTRKHMKLAIWNFTWFFFTIFANLPPPSKCHLVRPAPPAALAMPLSRRSGPPNLSLRKATKTAKAVAV